MKAGRMLDALVAEKVMGWENNKEGPTYRGSRENQIYAMNDFPIIDCPCYSTDISAAFEVVNNFRRFRLLLEPGGRYSCMFSDEYIACGDTAPEAICVAALKAVGFDEEQENK